MNCKDLIEELAHYTTPKVAISRKPIAHLTP